MQDVNITKNFKLSEFHSKDGGDMPFKVFRNILLIAEQVQIIRDYIDKPIHINSAYRSINHNMSVGGARRSQHLLGTALDIVVEGITVKETYKIITQMIDDNLLTIKGLGKYDNFTHIDNRSKESRW